MVRACFFSDQFNYQILAHQFDEENLNFIFQQAIFQLVLLTLVGMMALETTQHSYINKKFVCLDIRFKISKIRRIKKIITRHTLSKICLASGFLRIFIILYLMLFRVLPYLTTIYSSLKFCNIYLFHELSKILIYNFFFLFQRNSIEQ